MIYISYSSLRDYYSCKRKLYYRINKAPRQMSASLVIGTLIHEIVQDYEDCGFCDMDSYIKRMMDEFSSGDVLFYRGQTVSKLTGLMKSCFDNYLLLAAELPPMVSSEQSFEIDYRPEVLLVGKFDQVRDDNTLVEFKTGHKPPTEESLKYDLQATVYIWSYREIFGVMPTFLHVHLPTGKVYEIKRNEGDFTDLITNISAYIKDRENQDFPRQTDIFKCTHCDYRDICTSGVAPAQLVLRRAAFCKPIG